MPHGSNRTAWRRAVAPGSSSSPETVRGGGLEGVSRRARPNPAFRSTPMNDIELIPLGKLRLSEANVRKNDSNLFIEELAANIEAKGLLQNLIVVPAKKRGMFDVTAGGRRLRALNFLLTAGKLPKDHPVACRVLDLDAAEQSELSLIENVIRLDMTPTDEIRAYKHFVGEGADLDAIAKRFGRTRRFIEGRLRLGGLCLPVFTAPGEGQSTLHPPQPPP